MKSLTLIFIYSLFGASVLTFFNTFDNILWFGFMVTGIFLSIYKDHKDDKKQVTRAYLFYTILISVVSGVLTKIAYDEVMINRFFYFLITIGTTTLAPNFVEKLQEKTGVKLANAVFNIIDKIPEYASNLFDKWTNTKTKKNEDSNE